MRKMPFSMVLVLSFLLTASGAADRGVTPTRTIVWQGTVPVTSNFTVAKSERLEIRPGSKVVFAEGASLLVHGALSAVGQKGKEIVFSSAGQGRPGRWHEIMFEAAEESRMEHCVIESATWGVHSHDTRLTVSDCTFRNNEGGLRFRGGPLSIRQSRFTGNGIGLRSYQGEGRIAESEFSGNETGIFVREKGSGLTVTKTNFFRNSAYNIRVGDFNDEDVMAQGNWWGQDDPAATIFDGRSEPGIGKVLFEPFFRARIPL